MQSLLLISLCLGLFADASTPETPVSQKTIQKEVTKVFSSLRQKAGVRVTIKKRTVNSLLSREKKSEGQLFYLNGKMRLEFNAPDNSLVVLDGKTLWLVTTLDPALGGKTMVTKTNAKALKKSNNLLAALLDNQNLLAEFKTARRKTQGDQVHLKLAPRDPKSEIEDLQLWFDSKESRLHKIFYKDNKENEVEFELGIPEKLSEDPQKLFSYSPPKDAEVTEL